MQAWRSILCMALAGGLVLGMGCFSDDDKDDGGNGGETDPRGNGRDRAEQTPRDFTSITPTGLWSDRSEVAGRNTAVVRMGCDPIEGAEMYVFSMTGTSGTTYFLYATGPEYLGNWYADEIPSGTRWTVGARNARDEGTQSAHSRLP